MRQDRFGQPSASPSLSRDVRCSQPLHWVVYSCILPCRAPLVDRWTIELGVVDAGGAGPIWSQSDGAGSASEILVKHLFLVSLVLTSLVLVVLALLLALVLQIEEEIVFDLPSSSPAKPATSNSTLADEPPSLANNNSASHALPSEASRDHRTKEEIDAILPWVFFFPFDIAIAF